MIPFSEIGGVLILASNQPLAAESAWAQSSHSSGSATMTVPLALMNCERFWSPAVSTHQSRSTKVHPENSLQPLSSGFPNPGTPELSMVQPLGPVAVQAASFARASSSVGPRGKPSKSSVSRAGISDAGTPVTTRLSTAHHQSLPASNSRKFSTMLVAPVGLLSVKLTFSFSASSLKFGLSGSESHRKISTGVPPSYETMRLADWWKLPSNSSRQLESKATVTELAVIPFREIGGVLLVASNQLLAAESA